MELNRMYAYCLFCETNRCGIIADLISRHFDCCCISPQIIQRKWIKGIPTEESHDWLPGYIFLYSIEKINPRFPINGIIRCLGNGELTGTDLQFAEMLYQKNGVMGNVQIIQEGNLCIIADPSWQGLNGRIIKVDRGRKRCNVEFEFDGISRTIWIGYEMIQVDTSY